MAFNFFGLEIGFNRNRYFSDNYTPNFQSWQVGDNTPIKLNLEHLDEVYHKIPHLKTVIDNIAELTSNGKWILLDDKDEEIEQDAVLDLLNNPNPIQNGKQFITNLMISQGVYGNAFVYQQKGLKSELPKQLWNIKGDKLTIQTTGKFYKQTDLKKIITSIDFDNGKHKDSFKPDELIIIKGNGTELIIEPSKIETLHQQISNLQASYEARGAIIKDRGALGIISVENSKGDLIPMSPKEKEATEKKWKEKYGIGKGQSKMNFSSVPVNYTPISFPTKDLLLFEEAQDDFNTIIDQYGYNLNLLSNAKGSTFENVKESLRLVYQNTIIPSAENVANILTNSLGLEGKRLVLDYSHVPSLQENLVERSEVARNNIDSLVKLQELKNNDEFDEELYNYFVDLLKS